MFTYTDNNKKFSFFQINHKSGELLESPLQNIEHIGVNYEYISDAHLDIISVFYAFFWWERCGVPFGILSPSASLSPRSPA